MTVITLEQIGSTKPWVARILGRSERFGFDRKFVAGITDRLHSNSTGSRGITTTYELHDGCYEINSPENWQRTERYFAMLKDGKLERTSATAVLEHIDGVRGKVNADSLKAARDEVNRKHNETRKPLVYEPPVRRKVTFTPSATPMPAFPVGRREQPKYCGICHTFGCEGHPNG